MVKQKSQKKHQRQRVTFSFNSPKAKEVILMGDFNNWDPNVHSMKKNKSGIWKKTVMIYPGRYEYKFIIDGEWHLDYQNEHLCTNCFGTQNNVLVIT